ncbi:tyrosine-protein phosphatase [Croceicoccus mobilis]|uniref:Protein-tyrosine-phosphatase n=1 Tax=Croceicoccus mobilis TaxID=1703339 RepID=A0A917DZD3_9SPHN|nr:tyrosine-protein phosphatase [Croceicoccus mobilis]GGD84716.1 protein-tyrosine-phosphatase [Croceicoccus mobilis]
MTTPTTSASRDSRFVPLAGTHNFRRVEGWQTPQGARLRSGALLRSSGLEELTRGDTDRLDALGIARVIDLRSTGECAADPSNWHGAPPPTWRGATCAAAANLATLIKGPPLTLDQLEGELMGVYAAFPIDLASALRAAFDALERDDGALLVHCAAGKDRTGFVIAMILRALGIREEDVVADYLMTNESFADACIRFQKRALLAGMEARTPGAVRLMLSASTSFLDRADRAIIAGWGGMDAYLEEVAGLGRDRRDAIRARLIEA